MPIDVGDISFVARVDKKQFNRDLKEIKSDGERLGIDFAKGFERNVKKVNLGTLTDSVKLFRKGMKSSKDDLAGISKGVLDVKAKYRDLVKEAEAFKSHMKDSAVGINDKQIKDLEAQRKKLISSLPNTYKDKNGKEMGSTFISSNKKEAEAMFEEAGNLFISFMP